VEEALGISLSLHSSDYYGNYLRTCLDGGEEVRILPNHNGPEWEEEDLKEYEILVKISDLQDQQAIDEISRRLQPHLPLVLRSEVVPRKLLRRYKFVNGLQVLMHEARFRDGN
jgi:hypothetical protein